MTAWNTRSGIVRGLAVVVVLGARVAGAGELDELKDTTPAERATAQTVMMKTRLGLDDAQLAQVAAINTKYAERMEPVIKGTEGTLGKLRDARAIEEQKEGELKTVLSSDQFATFQAAKEDMRTQLLQKIQEQRPKK